MLKTENQQDRLKKIRNFFNLNQGDFAESIDLKQGSYSDIERGRVGISINLLQNIVKVYKINANWLLMGEGTMFTGPENNTISSNIISGSGNNGNKQIISKQYNQEKEDKTKSISELQEKIHHLERENTALQQTIHTQNKLIHLLEKK